MSIPNEPTYDNRDLPDALESTVMALLRTPQIRQAFHDLLRTYGIVAQNAEVTGNLSQQVQALAEAMAMFLGRLLEHERRSLSIIDLLQKLTDTRDDQTVADALAALQSQTDVQDDIAARARTLLRIAQPAANRADISDATASAQTMRETATADTAQTLRGEATAAAEAATETAAAAAAQTLHAAAAETLATEAEAAAGHQGSAGRG